MSQVLPQIAGIELIRPIGKGAMGAVFLGRQTVLNRLVAVKQILGAWNGDEEMLSRFKREAQAMAKINHPGVVAIYDMAAAGGDLFMIQEFIDGASLAQILHQGSLTPAQSVRVVGELASSLTYAAKQGILHRDLKPGNVFVTRRGACKLGDFGLVKMLSTQLGFQTQAGTILGTPAYMSPEQARGMGQVDARTDVYALAVMSYELLLARLPFPTVPGNPIASLQAHIDSPVPKPSAVAPGFPRKVEEVLLKGLEKDPRKRYASAQELHQALARAAAGAGPAFAGDGDLADRALAVAGPPVDTASPFAAGAATMVVGPPAATVVVAPGAPTGPEMPPMAPAPPSAATVVMPGAAAMPPSSPTRASGFDETLVRAPGSLPDETLIRPPGGLPDETLIRPPGGLPDETLIRPPGGLLDETLVRPPGLPDETLVRPPARLDETMVRMPGGPPGSPDQTLVRPQTGSSGAEVFHPSDLVGALEQSSVPPPEVPPVHMPPPPPPPPAPIQPPVVMAQAAYPQQPAAPLPPPPSAAWSTAQVATPVYQPPKAARRGGGGRMVLLVLVALLAAGGGAWFALHGKGGGGGTSAPLKVSSVSAKVIGSRVGHCPTAQWTFVGDIHTNGGEGTISYEWIRPDGVSSGEKQDQVARGQTQDSPSLIFSLSSDHSYNGTATLHVMAPQDISSAPVHVSIAC